jgi:hypothetical protein
MSDEAVPMETPGTRLTLARAFGLGPTLYRVLASHDSATLPDAAEQESQVATLDLNRQIVLPDGQVFTIGRRGGLFSVDRELWSGAAPAPGEPPLAVFRRVRQGWRHDHILELAAPAGRRLLLRRRGWFGSPANADVVALAPDAPHSAHEPVLLYAEKYGTWRKRLQARWLAPAELPLPITIFILNVLADLDRRAAAAASAGAAGV